MTGEVGTIYCLHFTPRYQHAEHYVGWTRGTDATRRVAEHMRGHSGAKLVQAAVAAGCTITVDWCRPGTRDEERRIKNGRHIARSCPARSPAR
jgi:hypothetical protein